MVARILFAVLLVLTAQEGLAQWPDRTISWVVPFAAGGATDVIARDIAHRVGQQLKQSIVIDNVAGAGGTIGAAKVAKAAPDGYTFLVGHLGYMAAAPSLYKHLAYRPTVDFSPVMRFPDTPLVIEVASNSRFKTLRDLIDYAKQNPGKLNVANAGVGSTSQLVESLFASQLGLTVTQIPYKGIAPAVTDLMGGSVDVVFDQSNTALTYVNGNKVRALAVTSPTPMPQFPGAETVAESLPGFEAATWYGLYAPKGTPTPIIEALYQAYVNAMADKAWQEALNAEGMRLLPVGEYSPASLGALTASEIKRWSGVLSQAGIAAQ
jgi:tripartite-type tricarboxylate transporter receptor subunit TctC